MEQFYTYTNHPAIACLIILTSAWLSLKITSFLLLGPLSKLVSKSKTEWDDILFDPSLLKRIAHLVPAFVISNLSILFFENYPNILNYTTRLVNVYLALCSALVINAALKSVEKAFHKTRYSNRFAIKGFLQAIQLILFIFCGLIALSFALDKNPSILLSSLGALTAVLMLIFKDPILGFVAGIQLAANNMIRRGDWIEMPKHGADGDVLEVSLTTVKVQNWDKTITTIPSYALISESFKNWKGMQESGGRRIKRTLNIDMNSIRFLDEALVDKFSQFTVLESYMKEKSFEVSEYNDANKTNLSQLINGRRLTNIGCFRAYCLAYLRKHPKIHQDMTLLVRQLQPNEKGLPIELYVFTNDIAWNNYEDIQADIFDHLLASIHLFELQAFQAPTGLDFQKLN